MRADAKSRVISWHHGTITNGPRRTAGFDARQDQPTSISGSQAGTLPLARRHESTGVLAQIPAAQWLEGGRAAEELGARGGGGSPDVAFGMSRLGRISRWTLGLALLAILLLRIGSTYTSLGSRRSNPTPLPPSTALFPATPAVQGHKPIADSLALSVTKLDDNGDSTFVVDVEIRNSSATAVRNVVMTCDGIGTTGATLGHLTMALPTVVPAHSRKTMDHVTLGFLQRNVALARCAISDFSVAP